MNKIALGVSITILLLQLCLLGGYQPHFSTSALVTSIMGIILIAINNG